ncbi:rod shape-determining protein MreC [Candidatus Dependentiae bacterium]|nr:rod shape-determining protein MreC [Candidatus Dependentiae bacterium]
MKILRKILIFCCLATGLFFVAHRVLFFKHGMLEDAISYATYPVLWIGNVVQATTNSCTDFFQSHAALRQQCQELQAQCDTLQGALTAQVAAAHYYEGSKELIDFLQRYDLENKLFAKVLIQHLDDDEHYYYINQGSSHGVTKDMVALYKFQILGRVTEVYPWYSKVMLITDKHCKVAAYTNTTNANGIVKGLNKLDECELIYVSHLLPISDDDLVLSSGQGLVFPEGFCLGQVARHALQEQALYHTIYVRPMVDFKAIKFCWLTDQAKIDFFRVS